MKTKILLFVVLSVVFAFILLVIRPVSIPQEKDCASVKGIVVQISEGDTKDVIFTLKGQTKTFYINRGLERGLELRTLQNKLIHKEIVIKHPDHWTPLDPFSFPVHVSKIECDGETLFSELK